MMNIVDVCKSTGGKIWHRKPTASSDDGLMMTITHSVPSSLASSSRNVRFLHAAFDKSGDCFVAGDHHGNVYFFDLIKNRTIRFDYLFGNGSSILGVLSQDCIMRFINIDSCRLLFDMGTVDNRINNVAVSPNGRHIVGVMEDGNVHVYSLQALCADINKPPAPLVKVVKTNKMSETASTDTLVRTLQSEDTSGPAFTRLDSRKADRTVTAEARSTCSLNTDKLLSILKGYGEYPSKYRMFIWRKMLCLPENHAAYGALVDKGVHAAYSNLHKAYPIKSSKLLRILQRILSALAHWAPIFGETQFLPSLAFPFVKLFQNNHLVCFEMIATVLVNWCQHWFEYFPNPPINILGMVENVLGHHDRYLLQHFVTYGVTSQYFFHHRNAVDVRQVVKEAYRLSEATPDELHPNNKLMPFSPLTHGQYPVFNKYPKFIVDYQLSLDAQRMTLRRQQEEEQWYHQQALLLEAEEKRRQMISQEEQKLADQRQRLTAMHREVKLKELQLLDAARRKFLHFQKQQREAELRRLDDEMQRKALLRDQETQAAIEEAEIRNLELQLQKKMFEQELQREFAVSSLGLRSEEDVERKQSELEQRIQRRLQDAERERELEVRKMMQQQLAGATQRNVDMWAGKEMEHRFRMDHLEREARQVQLAKLSTQNRALEHEVHDLMHRCEEDKDHETEAGLRELALDKEERGQDSVRRLATMESEVLTGRQHTHNLASRGVDVKFERDRRMFDEQEMELLKEVRRLRQKLATDNRNKRPPPLSAAGDC
nr:hypothetical protein BaRGS_021879 [Batillaria attramentaria]